MEYKYLTKSNIYVIPVGDYFQVAPEKCFMVYAPLANIFFLADKTQVQELENNIKEGISGPMIDMLLSKQSERAKKPYPLHWDKLSTLYIILNEKCNFHCSYCYSAQGRSKQELDINVLYGFLDTFLTLHTDTPNDRTLMFIGGGEPTLSWSSVISATEYAERMAQQRGINLKFRLSTNGSILTQEMIDFYKKHRFSLQISYDVLPDVQDAQRGQWAKVDENIKRLLAEHIGCNIRSTITDLNLNRIAEMVQFCCDNYNGIDGLVVEPVADKEKFTTREQLRDYFTQYRNAFRQAELLAKKNNFSFGTSVFESIKQIRERFCYNLLCITPYNTLTLCPNVSSPEEKDYEKLVFGSIEYDKETKKCHAEIDTERFEQLTHNNIHTLEECRSCWARWNCGGGCPDQRRIYSKNIFLEVCEHQKRVLSDILIHELAGKYEATHQSDFYEDIKSKLQE